CVIDRARYLYILESPSQVSVRPPGNSRTEIRSHDETTKRVSDCRRAVSRRRNFCHGAGESESGSATSQQLSTRKYLCGVERLMVAMVHLVGRPGQPGFRRPLQQWASRIGLVSRRRAWDEFLQLHHPQWKDVVLPDHQYRVLESRRPPVLR